jgi:hypothetical protein
MKENKIAELFSFFLIKKKQNFKQNYMADLVFHASLLLFSDHIEKTHIRDEEKYIYLFLSIKYLETFL